MKNQKEVKRIEDKGAVILENRCIVMNRMLLERNMNVKGDYGKISNRNKECVIRNWRKDDPCYNMAGHRLYGI